MEKIPGWVDLQVNGHGGVDFSSPTLTEEAFVRAADAVISSGTAVFLPTVITSPAAVYRRNLPLLHRAVEKRGWQRHIPGVHLEGPFLSGAPGAIGCHNPDWIQTPSPEALAQLLEAAGGWVKMLTVAAGLPGIGVLIRLAVARGIAVSLGHHLADGAAITAAADAGATALTHLGNGLPNMLDRHHNPIWAGLAEDRLSAMIITDGHHLPPEVIKCIRRIKGAANTMVVSDASPATGMSPGPYRVLGNDAVLEPDGRLHNPRKGCLVGSAATMSDWMRYLASLELFTADELRRGGSDNPLHLVG
ncbi:MAG: hypothetical protein PHQ27_08590, partial [Victivallales bacterium]|nr:hypothetical protein [Victivallales bacterium]